MAYPNFTSLTEGVKIYTDAMRGFVQSQLIAMYHNDWWERGVLNNLSRGLQNNLEQNVEHAPGKSKADFLEPVHFERIIQKQFHDAFRGIFADYQQTSAWLASASVARNFGTSHSVTGDLLPDDVGNYLLAMVRIMEQADLPEAAEVELIRKRVLHIGEHAEPLGEARSSQDTEPVRPASSGKLPYWWQVCEPHDAFQNPTTIDESLFAATLGDVAAGAAREEYLNPTIFFSHTYFTENLTQTIRDVASRLNFGPGPSVTEMQTPFGGGKTHALLTLYHLITHHEVSLAVPGVREAIGDVRIPPDAKVLVFDGQRYGIDPIEKEDGSTVNSLWGELAYQANPQLFFKLLHESDARGVAPGNALFRQILEDAAPCLILIDELVSYLVKLAFSDMRRVKNLYRQTNQFMQELLQLAGNVQGVAILISLPKSQKEFGGLDSEEIHRQLGIVEELQARADRVVSKRTPVNDHEIYTLMSKRLFKQVDRHAAEQAAHAYRDVYARNRDLYDPGVFSGDYLEQQIAAYPLHPEIIDVLYKKWSTASDFPRTRSVLQLLASVVADRWTARREEYAIQSAGVNLERERIRTKIVSAAGSGGGYDAVVAADIIGDDAHADLWDQRHGGEYERFQIARGVATTLLMHSFGGRSRLGALPVELYVGSVSPVVGHEYVREVLDTLEQSLWYVHRDGELRRFQTRVNVYRAIAQTAESQDGPTVNERLREAFGSAVGKPVGFRVFEWAATDGTIPDRPDPAIAVLAPMYAVQKDNDGVILGREKIDQLWERSGGGLRQWRNALILIAPDREQWSRTDDAMRSVIAFEWAISAAERRILDVSDQELRRLKSELNDKRESFRTSVVTAYRWVFYPEQDGLAVESLPVPATKGEKIAERAVERLSDQNYANPKILRRMSPSYFNAKLAPQIWKDEENALDLRDGLWVRLPQWTYLPILPDRGETLRQCIREGIGQKLWAVAIGDNETSTYRTLIERPEDLDDISELFDGSASLVKGAYWELIREQLHPAGVEPTPIIEPKPDDDLEPTPPPPGPKPPVITAPKRHGRVRLRVSNLPVSKTFNLQNYLFKPLQGQDPLATISISIDVISDAGIGEEVLEKSIAEAFDQLGFTLEWNAE